MNCIGAVPQPLPIFAREAGEPAHEEQRNTNDA
jgi:hypothetical protein